MTEAAQLDPVVAEAATDPSAVRAGISDRGTSGAGSKDGGTARDDRSGKVSSDAGGGSTGGGGDTSGDDGAADEGDGSGGDGSGRDGDGSGVDDGGRDDAGGADRNDSGSPSSGGGTGSGGSTSTGPRSGAGDGGSSSGGGSGSGSGGSGADTGSGTGSGGSGSGGGSGATTPTPTVTTTTSPPTTAPPLLGLLGDLPLMVSTKPNRSNAVPLAGATLTAGSNVYIFVQGLAVSITGVNFYLGSTATGTPYSTDLLAPYDLAGSELLGGAKPFRVPSTPGIHWISAAAMLLNVPLQTGSAPFVVA